jgi:hypothetical protein
MTDKKKTLLVICQDDGTSDFDDMIRCDTLEKLVKEGNTSMLVLRQASLDQENGIFDAVTSLSKIVVESHLA